MPPFLSRVEHFSLSLVLGRDGGGCWEGKHQFCPPFLQKPQVEVFVVPTEAGRVWHRGDREPTGVQEWDRQSDTVLSVRDVLSLPTRVYHP